LHERGQFGPKFQVHGTPTILPVRKLGDYSIRILAVDYFVLSQCTRLADKTDRQTDRQTERRQEDRALHLQSHSRK